jgi:two-component system, chemotaxis family, protein-glutamate methylesterase/glutaminase
MKKSMNAPPRNYQAVVIGASAGGLDAFSKVLSMLPKDFSLAVVLCLHLPEQRKNIFPELIARYAKIPSKEAEDKETIRAGWIYTAPEGYHLLIEQGGTFSLSTEDPVNFSRPSIDVLLESAAHAYGEQLVGILLTGANTDGAEGMKQIQRLGGLTIVQDPSTASSPQMPEAAIRINRPDFILTLSEIAAFVAGLKNGALE